MWAGATPKVLHLNPCSKLTLTISLWVVLSYLGLWFHGLLLDAYSSPIGWSVIDQLFYRVPIVGGGDRAGTQINVIPRQVPHCSKPE